MSSVVDELRVLIVADDPLARAGLAALLAVEAGFDVVGQTAAGADLAGGLAVYNPDVVLWDVGWNASVAFERLAELPEGEPPVVALLADAEAATEARSLGVRGLLLREASAAALTAALKAAAEGLWVQAPEFAVRLWRSRDREAAPLPEPLTPRELEVLRLVAEGLPNKVIAQRLGISERTAKFHVTAIMGKLGAQSRTEAVILATRLGLILL